MASCRCAAFAAYVSVAIIALNGLLPDQAEARAMNYPPYEVVAYQEKVKFIKSMMFADRMWWSVLKGTVVVEGRPNNSPLDHYSEEAIDIDQDEITFVVEPFKAAVKLMTSNSILGMEVEFVMTAVRLALVCTIFRHISLQGFVVYYMLLIVNERWGAIVQIVEWLEQMIRLAIDKLSAMDIPYIQVANLHFRTRCILAAMKSGIPDNPDDIKELENISIVLYDVMSRKCTTPTKPVYGTLITDLKHSMGPNALKEFSSLISNERLKGVPEMNDIHDILKYHGPLQINEDVKPKDLEKLDRIELKKIMAINRMRAMFVLLNLPINSLADAQWANLFQLSPLNIDNTTHIVRHSEISSPHSDSHQILFGET